MLVDVRYKSKQMSASLSSSRDDRCEFLSSSNDSESVFQALGADFHVDVICSLLLFDSTLLQGKVDGKWNCTSGDKSN